MTPTPSGARHPSPWPGIATTALRVAFGLEAREDEAAKIAAALARLAEIG